MEADCGKMPQLEFGQIASKIFDIYSYNDCVEFPPSWPLENTGACHSSSTFPALNAQNTLPVEDVASGAKACTTSLKKSKDYDPCSLALYNAEKGEETSHDALKCEIRFNVCDGATETAEVNSEIPNRLIRNETIKKAPQKTTDADVVTSADEEKASAKLKHKLKKENGDVQQVIKEQKIENNTPSIEDKTQTNQQSWASLLRSNETSATSIQKNGSCNEMQQRKATSFTEQRNKNPMNPSLKNGVNTVEKSTHSVVVVEPEEDSKAGLYAEKLLHANLVFKPQAFIPRGFINTSNWCYINATLQALLACPPFFQLLKCLPLIDPKQRMKTSTPIMDSFLLLASEFRLMSAKRNHQSNKEVRQDVPFEPTYVYKMLTTIKSSLSERGSQEDAEEFLSCVLNGIHEEMAQLLQHYKNVNVSLSDTYVDNGNEFNGVNDDVSCNGTGNTNDDINEWEEVVKPKRNRSAITRRVDASKTLISKIFRGELCTTVFRSGKKTSVSYEPFFTIPLHVPSDQVSSLEDAMLALTKKESFVEQDSNSDAFRQQTINILPPVLILHLKRFVYDKDGGTKKIDKKIEFKTELIINKELLLKSSKKHNLSQRSYKLFAVVYHHGEKVTGGHYTTDVFHIGLGSWLRIDDRSMWRIPHSEVTRHNSIRTPYILYYRRTESG